MEVKKLDFYYGNNHVIRDLSVKFKRGKVTTILGSNGCGKSTLFKLCTKELKPKRGLIRLDGVNIDKISQKDFAKKVAIVHQQNKYMGDITVRRLVSYGRNPHIKFLQTMGAKDHQEVDRAIEMCDLKDIEERTLQSLSGGQKQRVWIAMSMAQKTDILFLDEPTTFLDIKYQVEILELVRKLNKELGTTIIMVLHDVNQALLYSDEILGMNQGKIEIQGQARDVLTEESISRIYGTPLSLEKYKDRYIVLPKEVVG